MFIIINMAIPDDLHIVTDGKKQLQFATFDEANDYAKKQYGGQQPYVVVPIGVIEVYVSVKGGVVQGALANLPMRVNVRDFDNLETLTDEEEEEFKAMKKEWDEDLRMRLIPVY